MISFRLDALPRVTNYFWTRNGDPITSTARRRLTANGVTFTSIRREDTGVYTVTSVDRLGNGSAMLSINVYCEHSKKLQIKFIFGIIASLVCLECLVVVVDINIICVVILESPADSVHCTW